MGDVVGWCRGDGDRPLERDGKSPANYGFTWHDLWKWRLSAIGSCSCAGIRTSSGVWSHTNVLP
ncbi:hypothetical protein H5410_033605 [Solanum commersonii]|uniref:Uncharacterized protein n=1 Tax=Solanum commersonii TaxID=4109 RepID=A0A9J5YNB6_SOLCO|nr:hypothetical protein H5410_033605 [Solanum commersonii]